MKRIILLLNVLLILCGSIQAQEITRGQLMDLHYKAQKAERANNMQEALDIYKTILSVDASLPIPYLNMANIYAMDESNDESIAIAISLYNKYLDLQPKSNDKTVDAIKTKIAYLQKLAVNEQSVNLQDMLYINQEQAQNVIATKARPGLKVNTKAELEEQVEKVTALYDHAQEAINNNNIQAGTIYLEQLTENSELSSPVSAQAYSLLADSYLNQGNLGKIEDVLSELQNNIEVNKNLLEYYGYIIKESTPFEDDICGVWVSDLSVDKNSLPYFAFKIDKNGDSSYSATILPYCTFSKTFNMYSGKPFEYSKIPTNAKQTEYFANSYISTIIAENNIISFNFGDEKFIKGMSAGMAEIGQKITGEVGKAATEAIASNLDYSYGKAVLLSGAVEIGTALIQGLFTLATVSTKKATVITTDIQRIFAGCAELNLIQTTIVEKTTGYEKETVDTKRIKIYKLYPEYNIMFADRDEELFGYQTFEKKEIIQMDEYSYLQVLKDKGYFNRESYKKLSQKVSDYCWTKAEENPEMKTMAYLIGESFKYATKGLSYTTFQNKTGYFEGWTNTSGAMSGAGVCRFNNGDEYVGNWDNNKFSGNGKLTKKDKNGNFLFEYTGTCEKNKSDGKGIFRSGEMIYEGDFDKGKFNGTGKMVIVSGEEYTGTFKDNIFKEGSGSYGEAVFTGKWKQIERDSKKVLVPDGEGIMEYANGEKVFGKWKNGVYQNKKETVKRLDI
jgi:hypothetical protein